MHPDPSKKTAFMCKTDFDFELAHSATGTNIYMSEAALREKRRCVEECGIVEVQVSVIRVVQEEKF